MAVNLSVIFNAVDNISSRMASVAESGSMVTDSFKDIESASSQAMAQVEYDMDKAMEASKRAADYTDYWTDKLGDMEPSAMIAANGIESLVQEGYLSEEALKVSAQAAEDAAKEFEEMGEEGEEAGDKTGDAMQELEKILASAGIIVATKAIFDALSECTQKAEEFETSIAKLQTIAGGEHINELSDDIMQLSYETGISASELADVAYNAISAGTAVEDAVDMAAQASMLATAGFTDQASALAVLETAMNSYGEAAGSVEHVSDSLIMVQNLGVTTVADLSANMGKAIATASAYNVSLGNLEAAYISTTKSGINTAESTTYISSMLKELGDNGTEVSKILQEETGYSFGQLMQQGMSLSDVLGILYDSTNHDAEALMNLWGSAEAAKASNAIINQGLEQFNQNLQSVENSAGATSSAYGIMADTTEYAHNKMTNSMENLKIVIGENLNPALEKLYNFGSAIFQGIADVLDKYPAVQHAVVGLTVGVVAFVAVLGGYNLAMKVATVAQELYTAATVSATAATVAEIAIVAGAVAAIGIFAALLLSTSDGMEDMTVSSERMASELDDMNDKYKETCKQFGENSAEAVLLKDQIDDLTASYEASKMTVSEFYDSLQETIRAHDEIVNKYNETNDVLSTNEEVTTNLINKLRELASDTDTAASSSEQMESILAKLNDMYPGLSVSIEDVNGNLEEMINNIEALSGANDMKVKFDNASETYAELVAEQAELQKARDEAEAIYTRARERYEDAGLIMGTIAEKTGTGVTRALDDARDALNDASNALNENIALQEECIAIMEEYEGIVSGASDTIVSAQDAVSVALGQVGDEVMELADAYDAAYQSALSSISGQYDLWETVGEIATTTVEDMMTAMESQIAYWDTYAANLENLSSRNIEGLSEMIASMDNGSEESAAALTAMANASDEELASMVKNFNDLQAAQDKTASNMAELETDFSESMEQIQADLEASIDNMNMDDEAREAARATIQAYISQITNMKDDAASAASAVASATVSALTANANIEHNATGTTNSAPFYIAGEEGPELIVSGSGGGDTVFPTSETTKILSALEEDSNRVPEFIASGISMEDTVFSALENTKILSTLEEDDNRQLTSLQSTFTTAQSQDNSNDTVKEEKQINLSINGSGSINIGNGTSVEDIWESAKDNLKSVFISILQEEVFEEGDGAYVF